jgi:hypothetical protein
MRWAPDRCGGRVGVCATLLRARQKKGPAFAGQEEFGQRNVTPSALISQPVPSTLTFGDLLIYVNVSLRSGSRANVRRA